MSWWRDILRQSGFMCFFIIPIPIGAYTIHSGSSAVVAMVSYVFLSLVIPVAYVGCQDASFGPQGGRIRRWVMALMWFISVICGALPFFLSGFAPVDAIFESTSGVMTTRPFFTARKDRRAMVSFVPARG